MISGTKFSFSTTGFKSWNVSRAARSSRLRFRWAAENPVLWQGVELIAKRMLGSFTGHRSC